MFSILKQSIVDWCLNTRAISIADLYSGSNPRTAAINDHNDELKFIGEGMSRLLVQTPTGFSPIKRALKTVKYDVWEIKTQSGKHLHAADEHIVISASGEIHIKDLKIGDLIKTIDGLDAIVSVQRLNIPAEHMYDLEIDDEDHVYYTNGILSHNTTVVAMYMLWFSMFNEDKKCIIASKAMNHATEIMARIKFAYEELPEWLKAGCRFYNRTSIEFDNGSKIKCEATSEKTGRGESPSILFIDEIAFISRRIQEEMWGSITPALSTGGKFILTSTPNGDSDLFATLWRGAKSGQNSFNPLQVMWYQHPDRDDLYYKEMLGKLGELRTRQELDCITGESVITIRNKKSGLVEKLSIAEFTARLK